MLQRSNGLIYVKHGELLVAPGKQTLNERNTYLHCSVLSHSNRDAVDLIMVLICISLKSIDVKHLFMYLFVICLSWWSDFSNPLPTGWFVFLMLSFYSSLYYLDTIYLSDTWFPNIFSHSVACVFFPLIVFHKGKSFLTLTKFNLSILFLFVAYTFGVISKTSLTQDHREHFYVFF